MLAVEMNEGNEMNIRIEWPWGDQENVQLSTVSNKVHSTLLTDLMRLSKEWDVIIDKGVITFVEKS